MGHALFVDVRESYEYEAGHVAESLHMPIGQISEGWEKLPTGASIVVVCQIGQRSGLVAEFLRERDLDAHNLEGGLEAWVAAGLDLVSNVTDGRVVDGYARDLQGRLIGGI